MVLLLSLNPEVFYLGDLFGVCGAGLQHLHLLVHVGGVQPAGALTGLALTFLPYPVEK